MAAMTIAPVGMGVRALDGARATTSGVRRGGAAFTSRALGANAEGMGQRATLRRGSDSRRRSNRARARRGGGHARA